MFFRLIGLIFFLGFSYVLLVFTVPALADQYWDPAINAKIRNIKDASLQFASGSDSASSLVNKIKNTAIPYIKDAKEGVENLNTTVTTKVNQVQEAGRAVQSAYSGVIDATQKVQAITGNPK